MCFFLKSFIYRVSCPRAGMMEFCGLTTLECNQINLLFAMHSCHILADVTLHECLTSLMNQM